MDASVPHKNDFQIVDVTSLEINPQIVAAVDESAKSRSRCGWKRWLLALTMLLLISAASAFAALFAVNFTTRGVSYRKERRIEGSDMWIHEEAIVDSDDNFVTYEIRDVDKNISRVIVDSNREIQIYKTTQNDKSVCFVSPLFIMLGPSAGATTKSSFAGAAESTSSGIYSAASNRGPLSATSDDGTTFNPPKIDDRVERICRSSSAIRDRSILGKRGGILCDGVDVFWAQRIEGKHVDEPPHPPSTSLHDTKVTINTGDLPPHFSSTTTSPFPPAVPSQVTDPTLPADSAVGSNPGNNPVRSRRQASRSYYGCYYDFFNCYYFTFPDDYFNAQYFTCAIVCTWYNY